MAGVPSSSHGSSSQGLVSIFDQTLGADTASIDTGANGIAAGHGVLIIWIIARTADAGAGGPLQITVNNDTSAIYDMQNVNGINATAGAGNTLAQANWQTTTHGSGGSAGYPGVWLLTMPGYDQTTFWKVATLQDCVPDATAANQLVAPFSCGYRATTAISRLKIAGGTANLKAGSRLQILGTQ